METQLTPQLLGALIDQGYPYALAKTEAVSDKDLATIHLNPVKEKPDFSELPLGYQTFYRLTQEPPAITCFGCE